MKFEDQVLEKINSYDFEAEKARQKEDYYSMEWFSGCARGLREALKLFNEDLTTLEKLGRNLL